MGTFNDRRSSAPSILSSQWTGLSPFLIAKFYPVDRHGIVLNDVGVEVHAPITDGSSDMTLGWNSPFENSGPESRAPALSGMLQSGVLTGALQAINGVFDSDFIEEAARKSADFARSIEGRTGITKLNSCQVFSGMPPVKMSMTLHFRALKDPITEVRDPIQQLKEWAVPQELAEDGLVTRVIKKGNMRDFAETVFPSKSPQMIGMRYGDSTFSPMVIESISEPFTSPRSDKGVMMACSVQITLATLTALDRRDIGKIYR